MPRKATSATGAKRAFSAPKSHVLPEEFPRGMLLKDLFKREWLLGSVLGQGGFGLIYFASEAAHKSADAKSGNYVIKIEPKGNGPLFCEAHFYQRVAKLDLIDAFIKEHKLKYLSVPPYVGTGLENYKSQEYRFLVMQRLGTDLQKLLIERGGLFAPNTTFAIGLRMVDALQFLHEKEYVHADIKAANILLGFSKGKNVANEVYLVDFGLAYRYTVDGQHADYKEDKKRAHNGTIEFTSRDAHRGLAPSRRGDLEILGFCMLQWLCGKLPWDNKTANPNAVAESKESFMVALRPQLTKLIQNSAHVSDCMYNYFDQVNKLEYNSEPNYNQIRSILKTGLTKAGQKDEWIINFTVKGEKRKLAESDSTDDTTSSGTTPKKSPRLASASPRGRQSAGPSKSKTSTSAKRKTATSNNSASPSSGKGAKPSPSSSAQRLTPLHASKTNGVVSARRQKKHFELPAPTKPVMPTAIKTSTTRKIRRVAVSQSDSSVQTSPNLMFNK